MSKSKSKNIPSKEAKPPEASLPADGFQLIAIDLIDDPERPMRTDMTPQSVEDLVLSIKQVGLLEPLIVKPKNGRYEVIAGHRRKYSCELAQMVEIPCVIKTVSTEQGEMYKIHENLYRADIKPADEAKHFRYMIEKLKMTPVKIAQLIGKSESYVHDRLAIFNFPDFLLRAMNTGAISFSVAREFSRMTDLKQMSQYVFYAARNGMTQEGARQWVQDYKRSQEQPQIQETVTYNPETQTQVIEHSQNCVYCQTPVKLLEAQVVYIHGKCLDEANSRDTTPQPSSEANGQA